MLGRMMRRVLTWLGVALALASCAHAAPPRLHGTSNFGYGFISPYQRWSSVPQSPGFLPLSVWLQLPQATIGAVNNYPCYYASGTIGVGPQTCATYIGTPAARITYAQAAANIGMNVFLAIQASLNPKVWPENTGAGPCLSPSYVGCPSDHGEAAALVAANPPEYVVGGASMLTDGSFANYGVTLVGSISGTTLTVTSTSLPTGGSDTIAVGQYVAGGNGVGNYVSSGTQIVANLTGSGNCAGSSGTACNNSTWQVNNSQTVSGFTIATVNPPANGINQLGSVAAQQYVMNLAQCGAATCPGIQSLLIGYNGGDEPGVNSYSYPGLCGPQSVVYLQALQAADPTRMDQYNTTRWPVGFFCNQPLAQQFTQNTSAASLDDYPNLNANSDSWSIIFNATWVPSDFQATSYDGLFWIGLETIALKSQTLLSTTPNQPVWMFEAAGSNADDETFSKPFLWQNNTATGAALINSGALTTLVNNTGVSTFTSAWVGMTVSDTSAANGGQSLIPANTTISAILPTVAEGTDGCVNAIPGIGPAGVAGCSELTMSNAASGPSTGAGDGVQISGGMVSGAGTTSPCNEALNLCLVWGNQMRPWPSELNAGAWMAFITGANSVEWFPQDVMGGDFSFGDIGNNNVLSYWSGVTAQQINGAREQSIANATAANLQSIDAGLALWAPVLNATSVGLCTMDNFVVGTQVHTVSSSCTNGILTMTMHTLPPGPAKLTGSPPYNYDQVAGIMTLHLDAALNMSPGQIINVSALAGTGSFSSAQGSFITVAGTSGSDVVYRMSQNKTLTITGCSGSTTCVTGLAIPGWAIAKIVGSKTYIVAQSARRGVAPFDITLAGSQYASKTATIVYDSNCQYEGNAAFVPSTVTPFIGCAAGSETGAISLDSSGHFMDTFGQGTRPAPPAAPTNDYETKIYLIQ